MANTSFVMSGASKELAAQLQGRQLWVKGQWARLPERLKKRKIQLTFEKAEKVCVNAMCAYIHKENSSKFNSSLMSIP